MPRIGTRCPGCRSCWPWLWRVPVWVCYARESQSSTASRGDAQATYLLPENQRLQDDEFANPGLLWVEQGRELWHHADGASGASCATCHGEAVESMRGVRTRYPHFDPQRGKLINLEQQINRCREAHMQAPAYPYESAALLALTTFVSFQSRGLPMDVRSDGPAAPFFEAGKVFFHQRRGQLDLACAHCHDQQAGQRLRGEVISQGQTNGFPVSATSGRLWARRIACSPGATPLGAAEPYPYGADEYVNLELFLAWRGRGLPVETPAIRR